jgi:8-oxo-dGTP diphosphatase
LSGDGFVTLPDGSRRWGRHGAAGILARHHPPGGDAAYLVALRSHLCHQGGTWAIPGGALEEGETPLEGARREFAEEVGPLGRHEVVATHGDDHGGWVYWTVVVDVDQRLDAARAAWSWETAEVRWVDAGELAGLPLHAAFRATLARLGILRPAPRASWPRRSG